MRPLAEVGHLEGLEVDREDAAGETGVRLVGVSVLRAVVTAHEEKVRRRRHARPGGAGERMGQAVEAVAGVERLLEGEVLVVVAERLAILG